MWRMRAGMGDVVFAPLYLRSAAARREVPVLLRITGLRLMPGRPRGRRDRARPGGRRSPQDRIITSRWCRSKAGGAGRRLRISGQLTGAEAIPERLARGVDFDDVVLAIPVGALGEICGELAAANPRFRLMLDRCETVRTKAFQVWLTKPIGELRERSGGDGLDPPGDRLRGAVRHVLRHEPPARRRGYEGGDGPKAVAYFCAVLPDELDGSSPRRPFGPPPASTSSRRLRRSGRVRSATERSTGASCSIPAAGPGRDRLDAQYFRANVAGHGPLRDDRGRER